MDVLLLIVGAIVLILIIILCKYLGRIKCPRCHSGKVCELRRTQIGFEPKLFKETVRIKEYDNKYNSKTSLGQRAASNQYVNPTSKIITQEVIVEGTRAWYKVQYKCNKCGNEFSVKKYIDSKPEIN